MTDLLISVLVGLYVATAVIFGRVAYRNHPNPHPVAATLVGFLWPYFVFEAVRYVLFKTEEVERWSRENPRRGNDR